MSVLTRNRMNSKPEPVDEQANEQQPVPDVPEMVTIRGETLMKLYNVLVTGKQSICSYIEADAIFKELNQALTEASK